jgi:hypothetical protein
MEYYHINGMINGELFYGDNQGDWQGSGFISHIEKGNFMKANLFD